MTDSRSVALLLGDGTRLRIRLRSDDTATVRRLLSSLPVRSAAHRWGDEIYFEVPFHSDKEPDARAAMNVGEVAFWPEGDAIAIFFGKTPASSDDRPRAYSPCNIVGAVDGDVSALRRVKEGSSVEIVQS